MNTQHYTYSVTWSPADNEHLALCTEFPSLSWLAKTPEAALKGIQKVVADVVADMARPIATQPAHTLEYKLEDLLDGITPANRHDEVDFGTPAEANKQLGKR